MGMSRNSRDDDAKEKNTALFGHAVVVVVVVWCRVCAGPGTKVE